MIHLKILGNIVYTTNIVALLIKIINITLSFTYRIFCGIEGVKGRMTLNSTICDIGNFQWVELNPYFLCQYEIQAGILKRQKNEKGLGYY